MARPSSSTGMQIWNDHTDGVRFEGFISYRDLVRLQLDPFEQKVVDDCQGEGRLAHDWCLALEIIFRRLIEQTPKRGPMEVATNERCQQLTHNPRLSDVV